LGVARWNFQRLVDLKQCDVVQVIITHTFTHTHSVLLSDTPISSTTVLTAAVVCPCTCYSGPTATVRAVLCCGISFTGYTSSCYTGHEGRNFGGFPDGERLGVARWNFQRLVDLKQCDVVQVIITHTFTHTHSVLLSDTPISSTTVLTAAVVCPCTCYSGPTVQLRSEQSSAVVFHLPATLAPATLAMKGETLEDSQMERDLPCTTPLPNSLTQKGMHQAKTRLTKQRWRPVRLASMMDSVDVPSRDPEH
ncbi:unnamed protein product, partial [Coregonus sp. 'balchen']